MRYPRWFPYPKAWFRALLLLIIATPLTFLLGVLLLFIDPPKVWVVLGLLEFIFPIFIWAHIHHFFWEKSSPKLTKWIPSLASWLEGLWSWLIALITLWVVFFVLSINAEISCRDYEVLRYCKGFESGKDYRNLFSLLGIIFVVIASYLFHFQILLRRWWLTNSPKWFPKKNDNQSGDNDVR